MLRIRIFSLVIWLNLAIFVGTSNAASVTSFDSQKIAIAETAMWQSYYAKDYLAVWRNIVLLLTEQFQLSPIQSIWVGGSAARAAEIFSKMPAKTTRAEYDRAVLPSLLLFYTQLKVVLRESWDPLSIARAELDWWVARRTPGQNSPEQVGTRIAHLYAQLYGKTNRDIETAGYLRAKAADMRDRQSRRGRIRWLDIQHVLEASYATLLRGIDQTKGKF